MDVAAASVEDDEGEEDVEQMEDPFSLTMDKFGYFYKRNGTTWADGELRMHTGQGSIQRLGQIVSWNRSNRS